MFWCILKFHAIFLFSTCVCLEHPEPEVLLQPRNFNPHPYNEGGRDPPAIQSLRRVVTSVGIQARTGPVLFPPNPEDSVKNNAVDAHPYAGVARKQKIKNGRFLNDQENSINPRVYSGLANYAAKVLKKAGSTAQNNGFSDPSLATHKKNYAFSYTVRDGTSGDDFSHSQSQNAAATNGEYRVRLPDGRVQTVSYTADNNGYKANVKYSGDVDQQFRQEVVPIQHQQDVPFEYQEYDYYDEPQRQQQVAQIEFPFYDDTPYHQNQQSHKYQPEFVAIYPDKASPRYLHTSVAIAEKYPKSGVDFRRLSYHHTSESVLGPSVSTVSPPHFSQGYITTSKYSIRHGNGHLSTITPSYYKRR